MQLEKIKKSAGIISKEMLNGPIEEPLQRLARLVWDHAASLCKAEHGCANYHKAWSLVRLISLKGALPGASEFFIEEIARRIKDGAKRILISGSADTGLLCIVAHAIQRAEQGAQIVIVDRCKTPLRQCREYADVLGLSVEFHECDVRRLEIDPVDIVIAHSFLLFFPEPDRQQVMESWAKNTRPGAAVLLFSPISPNEHTHPMRFDRESLPMRAASVASAAVGHGWDSEERSDVESAVLQFWNESVELAKFPHTTAINLKRGLEVAGFQVLQVTPPVSTSATNGPLGVHADSTDNRAELIAVRI